MQPSDSKQFAEVVAGVYGFYGKDASKFAVEVWFQALKGYDIEAIRDAFGRHCVNPDTGQFLPKPADIVRMLAGSSADSAMSAWSKVVRAIGSAGAYATVVFDDPLIHAVIRDMGGWIGLCHTADDELPFRRNEFVTRYRGFRQRSITPEYPHKLIGISDAQNAEDGYHAQHPTLIGDRDAAHRVLIGGTSAPRGLSLADFIPARLRGPGTTPMAPDASHSTIPEGEQRSGDHGDADEATG